MDLVVTHNNTILSNFHPRLKDNFQQLLKGQIGLSPINVHDIKPMKYFTTKNNYTYCYYYSLKIPYAGKRLMWHLIFDPGDLSFAPDFSFNDDGFSHYIMQHLDLNHDVLPTLTNWNLNSVSSITKALTEMISLYKKRNFERLQEENIYAQINAEFHILKEQFNYSDIELNVEPTAAHFLFNLKLDTSFLPKYVAPPNHSIEMGTIYNPGDDICLLKISYLKLDASSVNTSIQFSPHLDQVLSNFEILHLPNYFKSKSLGHFVNLTIIKLQEQMDKIKLHYKLKKEFICSLMGLFGEKIIEVDTETFSSATILVEQEGSHFLIKIEFSELFPEEQPKLTLTCLTCLDTEATVTQQIDLPTSSQPNPENLLRNFIMVLQKLLSIENGNN